MKKIIAIILVVFLFFCYSPLTVYGLEPPKEPQPIEQVEEIINKEDVQTSKDEISKDETAKEETVNDTDVTTTGENEEETNESSDSNGTMYFLLIVVILLFIATRDGDENDKKDKENFFKNNTEKLNIEIYNKKDEKETVVFNTDIICKDFLKNRNVIFNQTLPKVKSKTYRKITVEIFGEKITLGLLNKTNETLNGNDCTLAHIELKENKNVGFRVKFNIEDEEKILTDNSTKTELTNMLGEENFKDYALTDENYICYRVPAEEFDNIIGHLEFSHSIKNGNIKRIKYGLFTPTYI